MHDIKKEEIVGIAPETPQIVEIVKELEVSETIIEEPTEQKTIEPSVEQEKVIEIIPPVELIEEKQNPETTYIKKDERHSFTEWLLLGKVKVKEEDSEMNFAEETEKVDTNDLSKPTSNIHEFESILDKFIRENPSISRPKSEFYKPENMAKQSNEADDDIATETLANIYYKQGAYKKAIRTYEKLCLIYPHKMSYFADLIQKIKQENKND